MSAGTDNRDVCQQAEGRSRATARLYDALGLAEYEAIKAFRLLEPSAYMGGVADVEIEVADVSESAARVEG